jgi:hypothetical protein
MMFRDGGGPIDPEGAAGVEVVPLATEAGVGVEEKHPVRTKLSPMRRATFGRMPPSCTLTG